jgi:hypothetical protein
VRSRTALYLKRRLGAGHYQEREAS